MRSFPWLLLLAVPVAHGMEPYSCRNGLFPRAAGSVSSAVVAAQAGERIPFRDDAEGCPHAASCVRKAYLVNGDPVLVSTSESGWSCAWYFGRKREFVGWLPSAALTTLAAVEPQPPDWIGAWAPIAGGQSIRIAGGDGTLLEASGEATWQGGKDAAGEPVVHVGSFHGSAAASGGLMIVEEGDGEFRCVVRMQLVSRILVVTDNGRCGGMNVRFDGVYRKQPQPADRATSLRSGTASPARER